MNRQQGFTLIELMITVAIIGILAAVAMPLYQDYLTSTGRDDAFNGLLRMRDQQEHYVLRNNAAAYTTNVSLIGGGTTEHGYYTLSVPSANASGYVLQATAVAGGPQENDTGCTTLTLSSTGARGPAGCWPE